MNFPDFEKEWAVFKKHLEMAYAQGFDDAADAILAGAQARVLGNPQPQLPLQPPSEQYPPRQRTFPPRGWMNSEDEFLREAWGKISFDELSHTFKRSPDAIRIRGKALGLPRLPKNYEFPEAGQ